MFGPLTRHQIVEVEAVYLCLVDATVSHALKRALIRHLYETQPFMYVYLEWLLFRWRPLYAKFTTHLPHKYREEN